MEILVTKLTSGGQFQTNLMGSLSMYSSNDLKDMNDKLV